MIAKLNRDFLEVVRLPDVKERLFVQGIETVGTTPEEFSKLIREDLRKYAKVVKDTSIRAE